MLSVMMRNKYRYKNESKNIFANSNRQVRGQNGYKNGHIGSFEQQKINEYQRMYIGDDHPNEDTDKLKIMDSLNKNQNSFSFNNDDNNRSKKSLIKLVSNNGKNRYIHN